MAKFARNVARDAAATRDLHSAGWHVLTMWECELRDRDAARMRIREFLGSRRPVSGR
jgi:DNA mismatch endonuclease (patch repair protein)